MSSSDLQFLMVVSFVVFAGIPVGGMLLGVLAMGKVRDDR